MHEFTQFFLSQFYRKRNWVTEGLNSWITNAEPCPGPLGWSTSLSVSPGYRRMTYLSESKEIWIAATHEPYDFRQTTPPHWELSGICIMGTSPVLLTQRVSVKVRRDNWCENMWLLVNIYMKGQGWVDKSDATPAFRRHLGSYRRKANQTCIFSADTWVKCLRYRWEGCQEYTVYLK